MNDTAKMFKIAKWITKIGAKCPSVVKIMDKYLRDLDLEEAIATYVEKLYCRYDKPTLNCTVISCVDEWVW